MNCRACWLVTNALEEILSEGKSRTTKSKNLHAFISRVEKDLLDNKLLTIEQDVGSDDHWFSIIGYYGYGIIVEWTSEKKIIFFNPTPINDILIELEDIISGKIPDRFYGVLGKHKMEYSSKKKKTIER